MDQVNVVDLSAIECNSTKSNLLEENYNNDQDQVIYGSNIDPDDKRSVAESIPGFCQDLQASRSPTAKTFR